jgi:hypothetical protein
LLLVFFVSILWLRFVLVETILATMKIEIDFGRPDELRKMKRDLEIALETIDGALIAIGKIPNDVNQPQLIQPAGPQVIENKDEASSLLSLSPLTKLVEQMPTEFSMSEIYSAANAAGITRARARSKIDELVKDGKLAVVQKGQGRRPTTFRKA